jgi:hypothetical protein
MKMVVACCLALAASGIALADSDSEWTYKVTYHGKPVVGAKVHFQVHHRSVSYAETIEEPLFATSDGNGEVRFPKKDNVSLRDEGVFFARDTEGRRGFGKQIRDMHFPLTIDLHDNTQCAGKVTDREGKPIPGLKLKAIALGSEMLNAFDRNYNRVSRYATTPEWYWTEFPIRIAPNGSFMLPGASVGYSIGVQFESNGFGSGQFWVFPDAPTTVTLGKVGAVKVRFAAPPGAKPGNISVSVTRVIARDLVEANATLTSKGGEELTFDNLVPGRYRFSFPNIGPSAFFPGKLGEVSVKPDSTSEVAIPLEPAARVLTQFVDSKTGKGVAGASLCVVINRNPTGRMDNVYAKSDAEGKIDVQVPSGLISLGPTAPDGYAVVRFSTDPNLGGFTHPLPVAPGESRHFEKFTLVKTVELHGVVVDETGKVIRGAKVSFAYSGYFQAAAKASDSDVKGRFVITGINPISGIFGITARKGTAITALPVVVDPTRDSDEIRIVISEKSAARVRVRAVDRAGRPIPGVRVEIMHMIHYLSENNPISGSGLQVKAGETSSAGQFESEVIQAGDEYTLSLSAPGYRAVTTSHWKAVPGEIHDYGDIRLNRSDASVSGSITDMQGNPVAGATVYDRVGGVKPVETKTDSSGRFSLNGLIEGSTTICIRAVGFRLAVAEAEAGGPAVTVAIRRLTDPPAPPPTIPPDFKASSEKLLRHLLESMWKNRVAANDDGKIAIRTMAAIDLDVARRWRDEEMARTKGQFDLTSEVQAGDRNRRLLATAIADPDEAIALLKPVTGYEADVAIRDLFLHLLRDHPDQALRIAEEAVVRARAVDESLRAAPLAVAGDFVYRAGKKDAGRKLIEEALKLVERTGYSADNNYAWGIVAGRLALFDPEKARVMIDRFENVREFDIFLCDATIRVARANLAIARKWLNDFRPSNNFTKSSAQQRIAFQLASTEPDVAVEIASQIEDSMYRYAALAGIAIRMKDHERAVKLIDATMDKILADVGWWRGGTDGASAALLLYRAKEIGHPDLAALRDKTIAAGQLIASRGQDAHDLGMVKTLALTDPQAARRLLSQATSAGIPQYSEQTDLLGMAIADPIAAIPIVDATIAKLISKRKGFAYSGLDTLAVVLSCPHDSFEFRRYFLDGEYLGD